MKHTISFIGSILLFAGIANQIGYIEAALLGIAGFAAFTLIQMNTIINNRRK